MDKYAPICVGERVSPFLLTGAENAVRRKEIAEKMGISVRKVSVIVERERWEGVPICSSTKKNRPGYFLAADRGELARFCDTLQRRARRLSLTSELCMRLIDQLPCGSGR